MNDEDKQIKEIELTIPISPKIQDNSNDTNGKYLYGILANPPDSKKLVVFVHGSGSGRHSPRNQYVAKILNRKKNFNVTSRSFDRR